VKEWIVRVPFNRMYDDRMIETKRSECTYFFNGKCYAKKLRKRCNRGNCEHKLEPKDLETRVLEIFKEEEREREKESTAND